MKLLLSNDDGVFSEGIRALARVLSERHEVYVAAPAAEQSCVSRGMTLFDPLRADSYTMPGLENVPAYAVSGTPVDCVRLGLGNLFREVSFDMVLSGINLGPNLGTDTLYSGTVAAAAEAALLGIPAMAVSVCAFRPKHLETAAGAAACAADYLKKHPLPFGTVLNLNVPDVPPGELRGVRRAPLCIQEYALEFVEREDPGGRKYYWTPRVCTAVKGGPETDTPLTKAGYAVVTPIAYDLTASDVMAKMDAGFEGEEPWKI